MNETIDQREVRLSKLRALRARGIDPFEQTGYRRTHATADLQTRFTELEGQEVAVAGKLVGLRSTAGRPSPTSPVR